MGKMKSQIRSVRLDNYLEQIFVKQNNFLAGEIDHNERIFYSIPRSHKNLFHLFHGDEGGLGINEEILSRQDFDLIKVKFCDMILTTTRLKWFNDGIVSPYSNHAVDKQIILKLSEINFQGTSNESFIDKQINLFEAVYETV